MRKCLEIVPLLLFASWAHSLRAQEISRCEYWIDGDYAHRMTTGRTGESVSLSVPLEEWGSGLHFFNFRAMNSAGAVGNVFRTMFYLPERQAKDVSLTHYESWLDDDFAHRRMAKCDESPVLTIDVSELSTGLHFFNFRAVNSAGAVGNMFRTMFYLPEQDVPDVAGYEYWVDEDTVNAVAVETLGGGNICLKIDVAALEDGEHTFSFRAKNAFGQWGPVYMETFVLDFLTDVENLEDERETFFDVYNLAGVLVLRRATPDDLRRLPTSIYVVNGKKVLVR